jgi:pilus assembly protein CpaB
MSPRRIIFLALALVAAGSTVFIGQMWLKAQRAAIVVEQKAPEPERPPGTFVLVAKGNLPAGTFIRPENLRWQSWPDDALSPTYVVQGKEPLEKYVGAVVRVGLNDGEPISASRVVASGDRSFLAVVLDSGYRAVTVNLTPSSGLAGLVFPGDRVDLVGTFKIEFEAPKGEQAPKPRWISETVLKNVKILAVDQRFDDQNKEVVVAKTATLEVTPKQAEIIALAEDIGKFSLSLCSVDQCQDPPQGPTASSFIWDYEAVPAIGPPPSTKGGGEGGMKVSVVRGADVKDVQFPGGAK